MARRLTIIAGAGVALVALAILALVVITKLRSDDPDLATEAPAIETTTTSATPAASGADVAATNGARKFVISPSESSAKYVVQETLRGLDSTAVGTTQAINGQIYLTPQGISQDAESKFTVDLSTLKSDESLRDNFIKQNTLQTNRYRNAEFVVKNVTGFPTSYTENEQVEVSLSGTMKIRDIEKDVTWKVLARQAGNTLTATADTDILFSDFGMSPPNVQIAKAKDSIHLQVVLVAHET